MFNKSVVIVIVIKYMLYSDNGVTHNYNAKDNTKSIGVLLISIVVLVLTRRLANFTLNNI